MKQKTKRAEGTITDVREQMLVNVANNAWFSVFKFIAFKRS